MSIQTEAIRNEISYIKERLGHLEVALKNSETSDLERFLNRVPNGTAIVFDKPMPNGRTYTYAVVRAAFAWYSTARMDTVRNPTTRELIKFIMSSSIKYRVKKIRLVNAGMHDEIFNVPQ